MMYEKWRWQGSDSLGDKTGIADFIVDGMHYLIRLDKFSDAQAIAKMLDVAYRQGKTTAAKAVLYEARQAALRIDADV